MDNFPYQGQHRTRLEVLGHVATFVAFHSVRFALQARSILQFDFTVSDISKLTSLSIFHIAKRSTFLKPDHVFTSSFLSCDIGCQFTVSRWSLLDDDQILIGKFVVCSPLVHETSAINRAIGEVFQHMLLTC